MGEEELRKIASAIVDDINADWDWDGAASGQSTAEAQEQVRSAIIAALQAAYSAGVYDALQDV